MENINAIRERANELFEEFKEKAQQFERWFQMEREEGGDMDFFSERSQYAKWGFIDRANIGKFAVQDCDIRFRENVNRAYTDFKRSYESCVLEMGESIDPGLEAMKVEAEALVSRISNLIRPIQGEAIALDEQLESHYVQVRKAIEAPKNLEREQTLGALKANYDKYSFLVTSGDRNSWEHVEECLRAQPQYVDSATSLLKRQGELTFLYRANDTLGQEGFIFAEVSPDCPAPYNICYDDATEAEIRSGDMDLTNFSGNAQAVARSFGPGVRVIHRNEHGYVQRRNVKEPSYREVLDVDAPEEGSMNTSTWVSCPREIYGDKHTYGVCTTNGVFLPRHKWTTESELGARLVLDVPIPQPTETL